MADTKALADRIAYRVTHGTMRDVTLEDFIQRELDAALGQREEEASAIVHTGTEVPGLPVKPGDSVECPKCNGRGYVVQATEDPSAYWPFVCGTCEGERFVVVRAQQEKSNVTSRTTSF